MTRTDTQEKEQNKKIQEIVSSDADTPTKIDQIAKVRRWFLPADDSHVFSIVCDFVNEKISHEEVAERIFTPIDEKIASERLDDVDFMDLWYSIIHAARRLSYRETNWHRLFVDLVDMFKSHSIPGNEKYNYLYSALPEFSMACREAYNDMPQPGSCTDLEVDAWTSFNAFFALLFGLEVFDTSIYAIWAMRTALETPHVDDNDSTAVQKYETYVPAAAVWAISGHRVLLFKEEDLTPKDPKKGNPGRGGELWKGKAEFSRARWEFWYERLAEIGKMKDISEATRTLARDAVQGMERAATFEKVSHG